MRAGAMAAAAARQDRLWSFTDAFYRSQGAENSGYVTDDFLRATGEAAGLDVERAFADRDRPRVLETLADAERAAAALKVDHTPAFYLRRGKWPRAGDRARRAGRRAVASTGGSCGKSPMSAAVAIAGTLARMSLDPKLPVRRWFERRCGDPGRRRGELRGGRRGRRTRAVRAAGDARGARARPDRRRRRGRGRGGARPWPSGAVAPRRRRARRGRGGRPLQRPDARPCSSSVAASATCSTRRRTTGGATPRRCTRSSRRSWRPCC